MVNFKNPYGNDPDAGMNPIPDCFLFKMCKNCTVIW